MWIVKLLKKHDYSILSVVVLTILWEIGSRLNYLPKDYMGTPSLIVVEFIRLFTPRTINTYILPSLEALSIGLIIAIIASTTLGFVIGINPVIRKLFKPYLFAINTIPFVVFFPMLVYTLGISIVSVIIVIVAMCSVPILINVVEGVANTDPQLLSMARSFRASELFIVKEIRFFSTLPYIFAGVKSAFGRAVIALVVAELYGLNRGIGYLIAFYGGSFHADQMMALVLFILLINCFLFAILWQIEKLFNKIGYRKETLV